MIRDVLVRLDGSADDEPRIAAASHIAELFDSYVTGLLLNVIPAFFPGQGEVTSEILQLARESGSAIEADLSKRLSNFKRPVEIRRFDVFPDEVASTATRLARSSDVFVDLSPNSGPRESESVLEEVLFGSGQHLLLAPKDGWPSNTLDHIVIGWNGSREAARALAEALPYLRKARDITIVVVVDSPPVGEEAEMGKDTKEHLKHHGINAVLHHAQSHEEDVAEILVAEATRRNAGLIVIGGYGHSPLRERLLGGVTHQLLYHASRPLLIAH